MAFNKTDRPDYPAKKKGGMRRRKKVCVFCGKDNVIDYKDTGKLKRYVSERGKILPIMGQNRWIEDIPVIMISAETGSSHIERAYELGVTDFISRPFDALIVHRRVVNTIMLYAKQKRLVGMVVLMTRRRTTMMSKGRLM